MNKLTTVFFLLQFLSLDCSLHIIGDSHSFFSFTDLNKATQFKYFYQTQNEERLELDFFIHWLGPRTMFRVGRDGLECLDLRKFPIKNNDIVVFFLEKLMFDAI